VTIEDVHLFVGARKARIVAAIAVSVGFAVAAAACRGSSGTPTAQGNGWLAFSSCMRSHRVSRFPDPDSSGVPPKKSLQQLGVSNSQFQAAQRSCRHLLPNGGRAPSQAEQLRVTARARLFSRCVRAHGVPNFPDPGSDGRIPDPATVGVDQGSPKFEAANRACGKYRPPYMPSNSAYNAWARTHASGSGS
jgi:hypothetical protein